MYCITFISQTLSPEQASSLFRRAIGIIMSLRHSLLGKKPSVFANHHDFDQRLHLKIRKFSDEKSLHDYIEYLYEIMKKTPPPHPEIEATSTLFKYRVASGSTTIAIIADDGGWLVRGQAYFKNPYIVVRALQKEGFRVQAHQDEKGS